MMIYQGYVCPLDARYRNRIEFYNEIIIAITTIHLLFFTDWIDNEIE